MFSVYGTTLDFVPYTDVGARRAIEASTIGMCATPAMAHGWHPTGCC